MSFSRKHFICVCILTLMAGMLDGCGSAVDGSTSVQISPTSALLLPGTQFQFSVITSVPNAPQFLWEVNGVVGGSSTTGTITPGGIYTAPATATSQPIQISIKHQAAQASVSIFDPSHPTSGSVTMTQNPLVAAYTIPVPVGGAVQVQFGTDTTYGLSTSAVAAPEEGGTATILVAGMLASTSYHMQATVTLANGTTFTDIDHTFVTGAIPAGIIPDMSTQLTGAGTASPGIELLSLVDVSTTQNTLSALATDLAGNVIWYYPLPTGAYVEPVKLLPNGHMLVLTDGTVNDVREIDLAGNMINYVTNTQINNSLATTTNFQEVGLSHDVLALPNGHWILLASVQETVNDQPGVPAGTVVLGNALIDWDVQQSQAVWTWSTFDHIPLTHAPNGLADWTHGNAVIYSPDDGDIIFSMRNQNWVVKINYQNGTGDGSIVWRLGPDGDFTLPNGDAPIEWNYGQHYPSIQSPNSSGIFSLMVFNNGNGRMVDSNGDVCGTSGAIACYSSVPVYQLNEGTMTVNVLWENNLAPAYSICCGDALILPSGNVEFDVAYDIYSNGSYIEEVTQTQAPELIWRMNVVGQIAYRGIRTPSLYPGQVWPSYAKQNLRPASLDPQIQKTPNLYQKPPNL
jgi:arylsulfate sulfotransferase